MGVVMAKSLLHGPPNALTDIARSANARRGDPAAHVSAGLAAALSPLLRRRCVSLSRGAAAVSPALLDKDGGCGTHALARCFHTPSTRTDPAYGNTGAVRQSSPKPRPCLLCSGASQGAPRPRPTRRASTSA